MTTNNVISIRRSNSVVLPASETITNPVTELHIVTALKNIESLGYILSTDLIAQIQSSLDLDTFAKFMDDLTRILKKEKGAHVRHNPMYPNFPQQVIDASDAELYLNAFMHYFGAWIGLRILPIYEKEPREALTTFKPLTIIELSSTEKFENLFTLLLSSKVSFSATDIEDISWYVKNVAETKLVTLIPDTIPNKENLATLVAAVHGKNEKLFSALISRAQTATDLLRIYAAISASDVSLSAQVRFANINKATRRVILNRLEDIALERGITEDMLRFKALWKTAGEKLHPSTYKALHSVQEAFDVLRNNKPFLTFGGQVETAIKEGNAVKAIDMLKNRPGDFARRMDQLLRLNKNEKDIISTFASADVAMKVATPTLWNMREHFIHRNEAAPVRVFFPKGQVSKVQSIENTLAPIDSLYTDATVSVIDQALNYIYSAKESLGKVFVDPQLKQFAIPTVVRSASRAINTVGRGTRTTYDAKKNLRLFVWWKDGASRTDLDLSAVFFDAAHNTVASVSYTNLREFGAVHSGDITSAPNGASEYIDIPIEQLRAHNIRYVMMVVTSFTHQPFYELPECFAGVMSRDDAQKGEVYEPRTLENIFDITSETQLAVPLILDLDKGESIWVDLSMKNNSMYVNNIHANRDSLAILNQAMTSLQRPNLFDLFTAHGKARGVIVSDESEADTTFTAKNGKVSVDAETILAEYL